jgi:hypothetical protein
MALKTTEFLEIAPSSIIKMKSAAAAVGYTLSPKAIGREI